MRDDDAQRMIAAYREVTVPGERVRTAMLERLLAEGERERAGKGAPHRGLRRIVASIGISVALAAATLLVLYGGRAAIVAIRSERAPSDAAMHDAQAPDASKAIADMRRSRASEPIPEPAIVPKVEPPVPLPVQESASIQPARRPATPTSTQTRETLLEEGRLLGHAQAALAAGDPLEAIRLLDQHQRKFPRGLMVLERRALQSIALCEAGRQDEGQRLAEQLLAEHPSTPHRRRIARACEE